MKRLILIGLVVLMLVGQALPVLAQEEHPQFNRYEDVTRFYGTPIGVYVADEELLEIVEEAIAEINSLMGSGFMVIVRDRNDVDIFVEKVGENYCNNLRGINDAAGCGWIYYNSNQHSTNPSPIGFVMDGFAKIATDDPEDWPMVVRHELMHALGVADHTPNPDDIMYHEVNGAQEYSGNDLWLLWTLYQDSTHLDWVEDPIPTPTPTPDPTPEPLVLRQWSRSDGDPLRHYRFPILVGVGGLNGLSEEDRQMWQDAIDASLEEIQNVIGEDKIRRLRPGEHQYTLGIQMQRNLHCPVGGNDVVGCGWISGMRASDSPINQFMSGLVRVTLDASNPQAVMLHEILHALGMEHSEDSSSIMYRFVGLQITMSGADKIALEELYNTSTDLDHWTYGEEYLTTEQWMVASQLCELGVDGQINGVPIECSLITVE